jgi:Ca-activated chloride channel family protein
MVNNFEILAYNRLLLLLAPIVLYLLLYSALKTRQKNWQLLAQLRNFSETLTTKIIWPHIITVTILAFAVLRPSLGYQEIKIKQESLDFLFLVDISQSMLADDLKPNRLVIAKQKIIDTIKLSEKNNKLVRLGLILFAGSAYTYCPLTEDQNAFKTFVNSIDTELIQQPGSNISSAISLANELLQATNSSKAKVILLSDFEEVNNQDNNIIELVKKTNLNISGIGIGTEAGSPIKLPNGRYVRDHTGQFVISRLAQKRLSNLSANLDKPFVQVTLDNSDLEQIILNQSGEILENEQTIKNYNELGSWLCLIGLLLLLIFWLINHPAILFTLVFIISFNLADIRAEEAVSFSSLVNTEKLAFDAYQSGDFEQAKSLYESALLNNPNDNKLHAGLAATLHQLKKYEEASGIYTKLAEDAKTGREKFEAYYNAGTSSLFGNDITNSISNLEKALQIKPDDQKAKTNLELAKKRQQEQEQKQEEQKQEENKEDKDSEKKDTEEKDKQQNNQENENKDQSNQENQDQSNEQNKSSEQADSQPKDNQENDSKQENNTENNPNQSKQEENKDAPDNEQEQDNQSKDNTNNQEETSNSPANSDSKPGNLESEGLSKTEAKAWLESLPEAPVILRQQSGNANSNEVLQTW